MSGIEDDFENEFSSIKEMSKEMLESDNLVKRIRERNGHHQTNNDKVSPYEKEIEAEPEKTEEPSGAKPKRGAFLKSFKSLRKHTSTKNTNVKARNIKVVNSNAPESSPIKTSGISSPLPSSQIAIDSSPRIDDPSQKSTLKNGTRRIPSDKIGFIAPILPNDSSQDGKITTDPHKSGKSTKQTHSPLNRHNPKVTHSLNDLSDEESVFNPEITTEEQTQPIRESFLDKLKRVGKQTLGDKPNKDNLSPSTTSKRQIIFARDELKDEQKAKKPKTTANEIHNDDDKPIPIEQLQEIKVTIDEVSKMKSIITQQLIGSFTNLVDSSLLEKYTDIYRMFEHTIQDNEGHSVLLIGPRGSGKSSMINMALEKLESQHSQKFITIRLNAFIHADDNVALREIAKQLDTKLGRESEDQMTFESRSINDTFANILATLDKSEIIDDNEHKLSIIFIIDEFDKFTSNNKQTLLYNLFDLCQTSSVPICIVGVSTKITVRESLEKRVRSRFSQRIILINKSSTLDEFWKDAKLSLTLNEDNINLLGNEGYGRAWNNYIENLYTIKTSNLFKIVFQNYYTLKNFQDFNNNCLYPISQLSLTSPFLNDAHVPLYQQNQSKNHIQSIVSSLSQLELFLTIAAARWIEKFELPTLNFNLAYNEYSEMIKSFNVVATTNNADNAFDSNISRNFKINQKIWSSKVMKNSWEVLYKLGLLLDSPTNDGGHTVNTNQPKSLIVDDNRMVQVDITLDELAALIPESNMFRRLTRL